MGAERQATARGVARGTTARRKTARHDDLGIYFVEYYSFIGYYDFDELMEHVPWMFKVHIGEDYIAGEASVKYRVNADRNYITRIRRVWRPWNME